VRKPLLDILQYGIIACMCFTCVKSLSGLSEISSGHEDVVILVAYIYDTRRYDFATSSLSLRQN